MASLLRKHCGCHLLPQEKADFCPTVRPKGVTHYTLPARRVKKDREREILCPFVVGAIHESPEIELTDYGKITDETIRNIPERYKATVDRYVIMPNHIHLIIIITDDEELRAIRESPLRGRSVISKVIGYVKMNASKEIHGKYDDAVIWQRGFHDHIIRDRRDYEKIAKYIYENPIRWQYDCFFAEE